MSRTTRLGLATAAAVLAASLWLSRVSAQALELLGAIQGQVEAMVSVDGVTTTERQELTPVAPGVLEAGTSVNKQVDGVQVSASASSRVVTPVIGNGNGDAQLSQLLDLLARWLGQQ